MKSSPTSKWIVDAALLLGYCVAVWFDLTGLELHQWIGVGVVLLAGYHLLTHWDWVVAVTRRFFGKTSPRARLYYLIDGLMLGGFVSIGLTGLLISTWLNLTLGGMATLVTIHEWTAYLTLAAVFVKLGLHWRWIVNVAGKLVKAPAPRRTHAGLPAAAQASGGAAPAMSTRSYTRRETFKLMGAAAFSTVAVVGVASKALDALQALDNGSTDASVALASATSAPVSVVSPSATTTTAAAPTATTSVAAPTATTSVAAPTATTSVAAPTATTAAASLVCRSCRRNKHCSYPGDCRDYVDTNGNKRCDLGECA